MFFAPLDIIMYYIDIFFHFIGATISENESFSLTSDEDLNKPTQSSSEVEHEVVQSEANSEAPSIMLPANHVIQYSPRLLASNSNWSPDLQTYNHDTNQMIDKEEPMEIDNQTESNRDQSHEPAEAAAPLYPRDYTHVVKTELQLQLDHAQNSNDVGASSLGDAQCKIFPHFPPIFLRN